VTLMSFASAAAGAEDARKVSSRPGGGDPTVGRGLGQMQLASAVDKERRIPAAKVEPSRVDGLEKREEFSSRAALAMSDT
jgi:hypothetical protein